MANFQVLDAYGSVITIQSSTFGSAERQAVVAYINSSINATLSGVPSVNAFITNVPSVNAVITNIPSVSGTVGASIIGLTPVAVVSMPGVTITSVLSTVPVEIIKGSIIGTYAEDLGHTTGDKGLFTLGVRNDTVASFVSADLDYTPKATDSAGRTLIKLFASDEVRIEGSVSNTNTSITSLVPAAGAGLRNYLTDLTVVNTGSVATLVTLTDGDGSVVGRTIAPATGGSNIIGMATPIRTGGFNQAISFQSGTAASTLYLKAYGYKAP